MTLTNTNGGTIDPTQLKALLKCYFRLSMRGRVAAMGRRRGKPRALIFMLCMYTFLGFMMGFLALQSQIDLFTYTVVVHSLTFVVVGMGVTSESGDILFNVNESDVLVHRPINPRTLVLAKSLNLIGFTLILAGALNLFPTFMGLAVRDAQFWFPLVHLASMIVLCLFCGAAVVCTYGLVIRFFDREKFDNFAAWSQVAMSILFIASYQIVPRLAARFGGLSLKPYAGYLFPLPPAWFAGIDSWTAGDGSVSAAFPLAVLGLAATGALVYVAIGRLAPAYGEGLARLNEFRSRDRRPARAGSQAISIRSPILRWWLRDSIERAAFRLAAAYMRRDRDIKLRLYPSLVPFLFVPLIYLFDPDRGGFSSFVPLLTIWMLGTMPLSAMETLRLSPNYLAAEIFAIAPLASAAAVFHGVRKATIYCLLFPAFCIAAVLIAYLAPRGWESLVLAVPGLIAIPTLSLLPGLVEEYLPLSRPASRGEQYSRNLALMFATMLSMAVVVGATWLAWTFDILWILIVVELIIVSFLHWAFLRIISNRPLARADASQ